MDPFKRINILKPGGRTAIVLPGNCLFAEPGGKISGQQVSVKTQQDIANILQKFEPSAPVGIKRIDLPSLDRELIVLQAAPLGEALPFTFDGRPYQRVGTMTADRTLQEDLAHFKQLRLIDSGGRGRGATYWLRRESYE